MPAFRNRRCALGLWMRARAAAVAAAVAVAAVAAVVTVAAPARAESGPDMTVAGDPLPSEQEQIIEQWDRFRSAFVGFLDCMGPLDVVVVDRAEDHYGGADVGPIAAFYRFGSPAAVFVEHGKVVPAHLMHEFAHHLDLSCGLGAGPIGRDFRRAQGVPEDRDWFRGPNWASVPAEMFAEAIVAFLGGAPSISLRPSAIDVIRAASEWDAGDLAHVDRSHFLVDPGCGSRRPFVD